MKSFLRKKRKFLFSCIVVGVIILAGAFIFFNREKVAVWTWEKTHNAFIASRLNTNPQFLVTIGNYYFNEEENGSYNIPKAKKYFQKAIKEDERVPDAWHQLARISFLEGNYPQALFYINNQLYFQGNTLMSAYYMRGLIYGYAGQYKEAQENFKIFLAWDNKNWAAHTDLAWAYFQDGKYEDSYATAIRGLLFSPRSPWLLNMAGAAKLNMGEKEVAAHFLGKALTEVKKLDAKAWGKAYPGNDPAIAEKGLSETIRAIETNLEKAKS